MNTAARYALCLLIGLLAGAGAAVHSVREGFTDTARVFLQMGGVSVCRSASGV